MVLLRPPRVLAPELTIVVHPIDRAAHPSYPAGWRWAIQVGGSAPDDLEHCANAGYSETEIGAQFAGEQHAATAAKAMRMLGLVVRCGTLKLSHDPIPASADHGPVSVWRG